MLRFSATDWEKIKIDRMKVNDGKVWNGKFDVTLVDEPIEEYTMKTLWKL